WCPNPEPACAGPRHRRSWGTARVPAGDGAGPPAPGRRGGNSDDRTTGRGGAVILRLALGAGAVSAAAMGGVFFALSTFVMLGLGIAGAALADLGEPGAPLALAGAVAYVAGVAVLTVGYHVPRNDALDRLDPDGAGTPAAWATYLRTWTAANHVRTLAGLAAA